MTLEQALEQAIAYQRCQRYPEAEEIYRAILRLQPHQPDANHNLGVMTAGQGRPELGLSYLKIALEADPSQARYWLSYVQALISCGRNDDARSMLEAAFQRGLQGEVADYLGNQLKVAPIAIDYSIAIERREAGRLSEAAEYLLRWASDRPLDADVRAHLAHVYLLDKQLEKAHAAITTALDLDPGSPVALRNRARLALKANDAHGALDAAQRAVQRSPSDLECQLVLAAAFGAGGRNDEALALVTRILEVRPNYADALANRAILLWRAGDIQGAVGDAERCLAIKPHFGQVWGIVGALRLQLNDAPSAISALERAVECEPENPHHLINLGELKRRAGDEQRATLLLERATILAPDNAKAWINLGAALQQARRPSEARAAYAKALELDPQDASVANNLGGLAGKVDGDWETALNYFSRAVALAPQNVAMLTNQATALSALKRYQDAAAIARAAIARDPSNAEAYLTMGNAQRGLNDLESAVSSYREALDVRPDYAEAQLHLAHALYFLDDVPQAVATYQRCWATDPNGGGMDAAIYLVILAYLQEGLESAQEKFEIVARAKQSSDFLQTASGAYFNYLERLFEVRREIVDAELESADDKTLYVIGESHALTARDVLFKDGAAWTRCRVEWIPGCKQWHLGQSEETPYRRKFEKILSRINNKSTISVFIGEIDCRIDEGISRYLRKNQNSEINKIVANTVDPYLEYVSKIGRKYDHEVIIFGVPCSNIDVGGFTKIEIDGHFKVIHEMNSRLRIRSSELGMDFVDLHAITDQGGGVARKDCYIDNHHLRPDVIAEGLVGRRRGLR